MTTKRLLTFKQVRERIPYSKTHFYRLIHQNKFPRQIPLGPHKIAFLESEVDEWVQLRIAAREQKEGVAVRQDRARNAVRAKGCRDQKV